MPKNLATLFQDRVYRSRQAKAISYKTSHGWNNLTWEDLGLHVETVGRGLIALGIECGDRVAILSRNRPEWVATDLAILSIGAVSVPIDPGASTEQVEFILQHSGAKVILASVPEGEKSISGAMERLKNFTVVWFDSAPSASDARQTQFSEFNTKGKTIRPVDFYDRIERTQPDSLSTLVYASESEANPKGVMLSHANILASAKAASEIFPIHETDVYQSLLPLSFLLERTAGFYAMMLIGASVAFGEELMEVKPTVLITMPHVLKKIHARIQAEISDRPKLLQYLFQKASSTSSKPLLALSDKLLFQKIRESLGGRIRFVFCGGASADDQIGEFFRLVGVEIFEGLCLAEASSIICANTPQTNKPGTAGKPLPGFETRLAPDGEMWVRGPSVMKGYFNDVDATRAAIDSEGFLHTGGLGTMDKDGYIKVVGRRKP